KSSPPPFSFYDLKEGNRSFGCTFGCLISTEGCLRRRDHVYHNIDLSPAPGSRTSVARATREFALSLLKQVTAQKPEENVFLSPLGVHIILCLLYNGADGATKDALAAVLNPSSLPLDKFNEQQRQMIVGMMRQGGELSIASALWMAYGTDFTSEFI